MTPEFVAEAPTDPWAGALSALIAIIEKPGCSCHYVDIGVGYQKVSESPDCPQCTPFGLANLLLSEMAKRGFVHESELVQVLDESRASVFQDDENGEIIHVSDGDEGPEGNGLVPLYRREPAGSVTT